MPVHLLALLILAWFIVNSFDEYTSYKSTQVPGLIETDPFARNPKTLKFDLKRGLIGKGAATAAILLLAHYAPVAAEAILTVVIPVIGFASSRNYYLCRKYKT